MAFSITLAYLLSLSYSMVYGLSPLRPSTTYLWSHYGLLQSHMAYCLSSIASVLILPSPSSMALVWHISFFFSWPLMILPRTYWPIYSLAFLSPSLRPSPLLYGLLSFSKAFSIFFYCYVLILPIPTLYGSCMAIVITFSSTSVWHMSTP